MTTLKNQITDALKTSMRAKDMATVTVLRSLQAAIKQIEVDERIELDDAQVLAVIEKQIKQRKESIKAFEGAGRDDLASKEQAEAEVLSQFLPEAMTEEENQALPHSQLLVETEIKSQLRLVLFLLNHHDQHLRRL